MRTAALRSAAVALCLVAGPAVAAGEAREPPPVLDAIALWLAANFGLAPAAGHPVLATATPTELVEIRYGARSGVSPGTVVAAYDDAGATIYLTEEWTGHTPAELSVLVHEMVHHLQASADMRFACPGEREALAYRAQDEWLKLFGTDLDTAFGIDPATLLVATVCTH